MAVWSYDYIIIWSYEQHMIIWSYDHMIIWSHDRMIICSYIWSYDHMIPWSYDHICILTYILYITLDSQLYATFQSPEASLAMSLEASRVLHLDTTWYNWICIAFFAVCFMSVIWKCNVQYILCFFSCSMHDWSSEPQQPEHVVFSAHAGVIIHQTLQHGNATLMRLLREYYRNDVTLCGTLNARFVKIQPTQTNLLCCCKLYLPL